MIYNCPFDNISFNSLEELCSHLKKFRIKQSDFFQEYYTHKDLLTGDLIEFKNPEQYLNSDFSNKNNLKKWLKLNPDEGKKWAIDWLVKRKEKKNLIYAPTQIELKSLTCPSIHYYEKIGGYNNICKSLGLKIRFDGELKFNKIDPNIILIQDSREQLPFLFECNGQFPCHIKIEKIEVGDYALEQKYDKKIYIDRKNLNDFVGSLSSKQKKDESKAKYGLDRFIAEIERAKQNNSYLILLVESDINSALSFNFLPQLRWTRTNPNHIFKNVRDLLNKYDNFQILFVDGKRKAAETLIKIFEAGESIKNVDLQYQHELGNL